MFTKGGFPWLKEISNIGIDGVGLDWTVNLSEARKIVGKKVSLQGNLDPQILMASEKKIESEVKKLLLSYGSGSGHVFNLGHGFSKYTPPENVKFLIECVHSNSRKYHSNS